MTDAEYEKARQIELAWRNHGPSYRPPRQGWLAELQVKHNNRCYYCGLDFNSSDQHDEWARPTIDHYIPLSKDGPDSLENCVLACELCNLAKADLSPDELSELPARRVKLMDTRSK